jgi:hypothetical protein
MGRRDFVSLKMLVNIEKPTFWWEFRACHRIFGTKRRRAEI